MLVRTINDVTGTDREVWAENHHWVSRRLLLKKDGMGFSFHETIIFAGTEHTSGTNITWRPFFVLRVKVRLKRLQTEKFIP
jgi:hypothetical protein